MSRGGQDFQDWDTFGSRPPERPQKSPASKVLLIILSICGVCALVCCGVGGFFLYKLRTSIATTEVPEEIRQKTEEIATLNVPERFAPRAAMTFNLGIRMSMAAYEAKKDGRSGSLLLLELPVPVDQAQGGASKQMREARQRRAEAGNPQDPTGAGDELRDLEVTESTTKEREIRGRKVTVYYESGTDTQQGKKYRQMSVTFPAKSADSSVTLIIQLPEEDWNDAEIEAILDSIR